ncbi:MAG TPA: GMC family oxidoreductase [Polyangia bacterium]|nr:GMC family oxidoreductase [Polyangia bacterium]
MLDAVVIGTGFGGAVSACRLAQAKLSVCVLERGRRYPKGSFPRDWRDPAKGWLWASNRGLYDVKPINEMTVVQAAGYGGGSLVYANVHLRPVPDVFTQGWPTGYNRATLDPYYDLVAYMLDIQPITASPRGLPPKTVAMEKVARSLDRREQFCYPNLAVNFGPDGQVADNKHGVSQGACNHCGECDIGCNIHAKNTLDLNYLALAERAGALVRTECEVTGIELMSPGNPGAGYRVVFNDHTVGGTQSVEARTVFVCAGAVNSSELLLRCRDEHKTLPGISERLGERYSGNGDALSFMFDGQEFRPSDGPTITTGIVVDEGKGGSWFILEDGGAPKELAALLQVLRPDTNPFGRADALLRAEMEIWAKRAADKTAGQTDDRSLRSGVFLSMGRDRANGRITLDDMGCLRVLWDVPSNLPLYDLQQQVATDVAVALGGKVAFNPLWEQTRTPVSVHNLGGCVMADSADKGVTDRNGVVFGYPGLYVMDGGALPEATGVNPSHTIAAVAERNVELAIRGLTGQADWQAPERAKARPIVDPVNLIKIPAGGTVPPRTPTVGITFSEKLTGHYQMAPMPAAGPVTFATFEAAEAAGKKDGTKDGHQLIADITITISGLDRFLQDPSHTAALTGTVRADGLTPQAGTPIRAGVFNLYPHEAGGGAPRLRYTMPFLGIDGRDYVLDGSANVVGQSGHFDPGATRVVYCSLRKGLGGEGAIIARGIIHLGLLAMINEMRSMRVTGTASLGAKKDALAAFLKAFAGPVAESFVKEIIPGI